MISIFLLLWKFIDPIALTVDVEHPQQQVTVPLDAGRLYRLRKVSASAIKPFCLSVVENAQVPRVISSDCVPAGLHHFDFDAKESTIVGGPGRSYQIVLSSFSSEYPLRVFVRGVIEILPVPKGEQ